jgi:hypothetical protein
VSSTSMNAARATTTAISHGLNFGCHGSAASEGPALAPPEAAELEESESSAIFGANRVLLFLASALSFQLNCHQAGRLDVWPCIFVIHVSQSQRHLLRLWTVVGPSKKSDHRTRPSQVGVAFHRWRSPPFDNIIR